MDQGKRSYISTGKITDKRLQDYGIYDDDIHLMNVIQGRLNEGWTEEEIIAKYRRDASSMFFYNERTA